MKNPKKWFKEVKDGLRTRGAALSSSVKEKFMQKGGAAVKRLEEKWNELSQWNLSFRNWKFHIHKGDFVAPETVPAPTPAPTSPTAANPPVPQDNEEEPTGRPGWVKVVAGLVIILVAGFIYLASVFRSITRANNQDIPYRLPVLATGIVLLLLVSACVWAVSKIPKDKRPTKTEDPPDTWWVRFKKKYPRCENIQWIAVGIALGMVLVQWVSYQTGFRGYQAVWIDKSFGAINLTIWITLTVLTVVDHKTVSRVMKITLAAALVAAFYIGVQPYRSSSAKSTGLDQRQATARVDFDPIFVKKGTVLEIHWHEIYKIDDVPLYFRQTGQEAWKFCGPGEKFNLPPSVDLIQFKSDETDFTVKKYKKA